MHKNITVIKSQKTFGVENIKEIWRYKELLYFLAWRDFKVKYKQTVFGILWTLLQPLTTMIVFSVVFGTFIKIPSSTVPYPIFVFTGLLFWDFFSSSLSKISSSIIDNQSLITKIYFPRLILPLAAPMTKFIDFFIASLILIGMMIYFRYTPHLLGYLILPLLLGIAFFSALGIGLLFASLNVKYRDVKYILPFFIQTIFFITPVIYPPTILGRHSWILNLNPMTGIINTARSILLGSSVHWVTLFLAGGISVLLLLVGLAYFYRTKRSFADNI